MNMSVCGYGRIKAKTMGTGRKKIQTIAREMIKGFKLHFRESGI